ncbi:MAG: radical SAM protein [Bacteroidales bacterium]
MEEFSLSKYNFYIEYKHEEDRIIYFNGISRAIFSANKNEHNFFQHQFLNIDSLKKKYPTLFEYFVSNLFIIETNFDEIGYIKYLNNKDIFLDTSYRVMINPTLECNFKCWYCYEKHPNGYMSDEIQNKIIKHLEFVAKYRCINHVDLSWFGGEPLLYFNSIVYPLSSVLKEIAVKNSLKFTNHATTNAYLIDHGMVEKFKDISLDSFQITIDGDERKHNSIRNENGDPSFKKIIYNINLICKEINSAHIILRINYDNNTLRGILPLFEMFPSKYRNKITISLHRVWQTITETNKNHPEYASEFNQTLKKASELGYHISHADNVPKLFRRCHCDKYWNTEVNYDGKIFKCTMDYSEETQGEFLSNGDIKWGNNLISNMYGRATFDNEKCILCKLLPICLGPCSRSNLKNISCVNNATYCNMDDSEISYKDIIINYYMEKKTMRLL